MCGRKHGTALLTPPLLGPPQDYLTKILAEGAEAADEVASRTLVNAKRAMGFTLPGDTKLPKL